MTEASEQRIFCWSLLRTGFPGGCGVKNLLTNAGDTGDSGSIPGSERFSGEGNGNPLQYACLENSMDRGAWQVTDHRVEKSPTQAHTHTSHHPLRTEGLSRARSFTLMQRPAPSKRSANVPGHLNTPSLSRSGLLNAASLLCGDCNEQGPLLPWNLQRGMAGMGQRKRKGNRTDQEGESISSRESPAS